MLGRATRKQLLLLFLLAICISGNQASTSAASEEFDGEQLVIPVHDSEDSVVVAVMEEQDAATSNIVSKLSNNTHVSDKFLLQGEASRVAWRGRQARASMPCSSGKNSVKAAV